MEMEESKFDSLVDIARKEKVGTSYVSKVFNLKEPLKNQLSNL